MIERSGYNDEQYYRDMITEIMIGDHLICVCIIYIFFLQIWKWQRDRKRSQSTNS